MTDYKKLTDSRLVELAVSGTDGAYAELVERYEKRVIASALFITRSYHAAEDAAQDAFVLAWRHLDSLRDGDKFCPFVCRIAKNCAVNAIRKSREALFEDLPEEAQYLPDTDEEIVLRQCIDALPEKVRSVMLLHYFEGYSVKEIADATGSPTGTVKWHLSEGRRRIKEVFGIKDTEIRHGGTDMVQRVMERADALKRSPMFGYLNRDEFKKQYDEILAEIHSLPESREKNYALADVLLSGHWYLHAPGEYVLNNLSPEVKEAALKGGNDEVLCFSLSNECIELEMPEKIAHIRDVQIPFLLERGLERPLGDAYFRLGHCLFHGGDDPEGGFEAFRAALNHLPKSGVQYALTLAAMELEALRLRDEAIPKSEAMPRPEVPSHIRCFGMKLFREDGALQIRETGSYYSEWNFIPRPNAGNVFQLAPTIDGYFFSEGMKIGEVRTFQNGSFVKFCHRDGIVDTPAGRFEKCSLWQTGQGYYTTDTYYKDGVGIVMIPFGDEGRLVLRDCKIVGGGGMLPLFPGNRWEYELQRSDGSVRTTSRFEVVYDDGDCTVISGVSYTDMHTFDTSSWDDMVFHLTHGFYDILEDNKAVATGVPYSARYALETADTPFRRAYTELLCHAVERITDTDADTNPSRTEAGVSTEFNMSFLGKCIRAGASKPQILAGLDVPGYMDLREIHIDEGDYPESIYSGDYYVGWNNYDYGDDKRQIVEMGGLLREWQLIFGKFWDDEWLRGEEITPDIRRFFTSAVAKFSDAGTVVVAGGTFEGCVFADVLLEMPRPFHSFAEKTRRRYVLAPGIGIIRLLDDATGAVYDLESYSGTGTGYLPLCEGISRKYVCRTDDPDFKSYTILRIERHPSGRLALIQCSHGCVTVKV